MSKVTFKEVAQLAGVSTQTVSRVTNGGKGVNPETLKRVQAAIDELGYVPNKGAQLLVRQKAKTFGVLSLPMTFQGAASIVGGIRTESEKEGYSMSLAVADSDEEKLEEAIREFKSQQVEAILINMPVTAMLAEKMVTKHRDIPFLFIDVPSEAKVNQVSADHFDGAKQMANLMLQHGRRHFALICGPLDSYTAELRQMAWKQEIEKADANIAVEVEGDWSAQSGYVETVKLLAQARKIDAILVGNDQMALGVLRACNERKVSVPEQIAVIGFDDTLNSEYFNPPLTTVHQNFMEVGRQAVFQIMKQLDDNNELEHVLVPVHLVERQSTAPLCNDDKAVQKLENLVQEIQGLLPSLKG